MSAAKAADRVRKRIKVSSRDEPRIQEPKLQEPGPKHSKSFVVRVAGGVRVGGVSNAASSGLVEIFKARVFRALETLSSSLDRKTLNKVAAASTDMDVLVEALLQPGALKSMLASDPLAEAKLLGQLHRKELLNTEGGVLGPEEVGSLLGIQRQSVDKRRKAGTLLAINLGNRFVYPAWQITGNKTLPHLEETLEALKNHDEWRKLSFFVNGNVRLGGKSPLQALRGGERDEVLKAASAVGEHGAA